VFDILDDYAGKVSVWSAAGATPLDEESSVLAFCENFFAQFFQNEMGSEITSITSVASRRAGVIRRRSSTTAAQRRVIRRFQHLCKVHADLVGETYGSGGDERAEFFFSDLPELLHSIESWAEDAGHMNLRQRVQRTIVQYDAFLDEAPPYE
jgi:hypothetical protein